MKSKLKLESKLVNQFTLPLVTKQRETARREKLEAALNLQSPARYLGQKKKKKLSGDEACEVVANSIV